MIAIFESGSADKNAIFARAGTKASPEIENMVAAILADVRERGDEAVLSYCEKFDGVKLTSLRVEEAEIDAAYDDADGEFVKTLEMAAENIRVFHGRQAQEGFSFEPRGGITLGQKVTPLETAGIYVPGGTANYPSTVLMNVIPAKIAGVPRIVMATPPGKDGNISMDVLAAAKVAGVTDIFKIGGAQAIAALAYGTESVPAVDKIVGPGNIYVATAKRMVFGTVDIDMIAGPSEILVIADDMANPAYVAADLLSQAEHDKMASASLVCTSIAFAGAVSEELERQIPALARADIARAAIDSNGRIIVAKGLPEAVEIANKIAPEHLELCVDDPFKYLSAVKNAGSIFLGKYAPEALGDYWAGPNHTLPTMGTARFSSPLSVYDFVKRSSYIFYSKDALSDAKDRIADFAKREGLQAHAKSIEIRFEEPQQ